MRRTAAGIGVLIAVASCAGGVDGAESRPLAKLPASSSAAAGGATAPVTSGTGGIGGVAGTRANPPTANAGGAAGTAPAPVSIPVAGGDASGGKQPRLPEPKGDCPMLVTGNIMLMGHTVQLWVGMKSEAKTGPVFFYWHGTNSSSREASLLGPALTEIQQLGGLVASFEDSTKAGSNTGNNVWYTGDYELADQILACAVQQLNIDTHRIYTGGCSAGGLQAGAMLYGRSSYLAAVMPNSGGIVFSYQLEDASHVPALITTHGAMGSDKVGVEFTTTSLREAMDIAMRGGFAVDCDHGGGHCGAPAEYVAAQWQFLKDHPFGVAPEPYAAGLPAGFPSGCKVIK